MNNPKNEKQILAQLKKESQILTEKAKNCTSKAECVELERQLQEYHYTFNQWSQSFIKNKDKVSLEAKEFYEQQRKETLSDIQEVHKRIASFERQETNSVVLKTDNKSRTPLFEGVGEYEINGKKFRGTWGTGSMNAGLGWNPEGPDYIKVVSGRHSLTFTTHEPTNPLYGISQDMLGYAIKDGASLAESRKGKQIRDKIHKFYGDDSPKAAVYLGWFDYEDPELKTYLNKANVYEKSQSFHPKTEKMKSERQKYVDDGLPGGSFSYEVCVNYFCNSKGITSDLQKTTNEIGFSLGGKGYSFGAGGGYSWRVKELMEKVKTNDKK